MLLDNAQPPHPVHRCFRHFVRFACSGLACRSMRYTTPPAEGCMLRPSVFDVNSRHMLENCSNALRDQSTPTTACVTLIQSPTECGDRTMTSNIAAVLMIAAACTRTASAANSVEGVPVLQVTAPNGAVSTLLGTMHVGYAGLRQPDPTVLDKARILVIEHGLEQARPDIDVAPEAVAALHTTGEWGRANWAKSLNDQQIERIRANLNCSSKEKLTREQFDSLLVARVPWLLSAAAFLTCPYLPGRDALLVDAARKRGTAIVELESQQDIAARRKAMPDHIYVQQLRYGLATDLDTLYRGLVRAMNDGDYGAIARTVSASFDSPADAAVYHRILVSERNAAWMSRLVPELNSGNAVVAVGAAHLPGPDGLVSLLTKAGYRIRPTTIPGRSTP